MVKMQPGDWLTVAEAAEVIGVTAKRVHAIIRDGRLKATRAGVQFLLLRADAQAFAKKPRTPGRPAKPAVKKPQKK